MRNRPSLLPRKTARRQRQLAAASAQQEELVEPPGSPKPPPPARLRQGAPCAGRQKSSRGAAERVAVTRSCSGRPYGGPDSFEEVIRCRKQDRTPGRRVERPDQEHRDPDHGGLPRSHGHGHRQAARRSSSTAPASRSSRTRSPAARPRRPADALLALLVRPTAIAFLETDGDPVAVAKALSNAARDTKVLQIRGGFSTGRRSARTRSRASRRSRRGRAARPAGQRRRRPADDRRRAVHRAARDLVNVLDACIKQLEEQGETVPEPQAEAQAEEVTEEVIPEAPAEEAPAAEEEPVAEEAPEAEATPKQIRPKPNRLRPRPRRRNGNEDRHRQGRRAVGRDDRPRASSS